MSDTIDESDFILGHLVVILSSAIVDLMDIADLKRLTYKAEWSKIERVYLQSDPKRPEHVILTLDKERNKDDKPH